MKYILVRLIDKFECTDVVNFYYACYENWLVVVENKEKDRQRHFDEYRCLSPDYEGD